MTLFVPNSSLIIILYVSFAESAVMRTHLLASFDHFTCLSRLRPPRAHTLTPIAYLSPILFATQCHCHFIMERELKPPYATIITNHSSHYHLVPGLAQLLECHCVQVIRRLDKPRAHFAQTSITYSPYG